MPQGFVLLPGAAYSHSRRCRHAAVQLIFEQQKRDTLRLITPSLYSAEHIMPDVANESAIAEDASEEGEVRAVNSLSHQEVAVLCVSAGRGDRQHGMYQSLFRTCPILSACM